ncbi:MAG: hypothetical protein IRZ05_20520 [Micromonosporaceae bacterium]|nr:hypothetical protein [Micromonosporaceae bacterium]
MTINVAELLKQFIQDLLGNRDSALQFARDPHGTLAAQGITEGDLSTCDVRQVVSDVCNSGQVSTETRSALQSYTSGSSGPSYSHGHQSVDQVVQHLNYVTYAAYSDDDTIINQITDNSIDNSTDIDVDGDFHGDIDVDNANATGDGAVAANTGTGNVNAATGDGAQVIDGDNFGQANTGDGAVQIDGVGLGGLRTVDGGFGSGIGPINTGVNTGVIADGPVSDTVVGDHNTTANVDGGVDGVLNFGDGDVTNVSHANLDDSAVAGHDLGYSDSHDIISDSHDNTSTVNAHDSVVGVGQDDSEVDQQHVDNSHDTPHPALEPMHAEAPAPLDATDLPS